MKQGNIIDLVMYRNRQDANQVKKDSPISEELEAAIQHLIQRLRELDPI